MNFFSGSRTFDDYMVFAYSKINTVRSSRFLSIQVTNELTFFFFLIIQHFEFPYCHLRDTTETMKSVLIGNKMLS